MKYSELYKTKLVTADEVMKNVKSGDIVDYGFFNGKPVICDQALAKRAGELENVSVYSAVTLPPIPEVAKFPGSFIYIDWQWSKLTRMLDKGFNSAYYSPILYHNAPALYEYFNIDPTLRSYYYDNPQMNKDVTWFGVTRVGSMDQNGYFNLGPQNSETLSKLKKLQ
jgi:acyl-CoA hydrolase